MSTSRFRRLLDIHQKGNPTPEEEAEFRELLSSDKESIQKEIGDRWLELSDLEDINLSDKRKLKAQADKRRILSYPLRRVRYLWAAAAVILLAISTYITIRNKPDVESISVQTDTDKAYKFHGKKYVVLPDGSSATMNEGSELVYHESYGEALREVELKGEAYFIVKPDKVHAFVVRSGGVQTHVLGTEFNVNAFNKEDVVVTVFKGKVQVLEEMREIGVITKNQQISVNTSTHQFQQKTVKAESFVAWKGKFLILDEVTLEDAVRLISVRYGVEIVLDEGLKDCLIHFAFLNDESLTEVLQTITELTGSQCLKSDNLIKLTGKGCN